MCVAGRAKITAHLSYSHRAQFPQGRPGCLIKWCNVPFHWISVVYLEALLPLRLENNTISQALRAWCLSEPFILCSRTHGPPVTSQQPSDAQTLVHVRSARSSPSLMRNVDTFISLKRILTVIRMICCCGMWWGTSAITFVPLHVSSIKGRQ